jgi:glycosyltransferase involved in cell wall biosynthesis
MAGGIDLKADTSDVSVIIPYYNRERYIDEAVQSVLGQTLKPLEVIIVNDCSREASRRYLDRYANSCRILDLHANVGLAEARNVGIKASRGRFVAFLDDDDIWLPDKLEQQREYLGRNPQCAIVHSAVTMFFGDGSEATCKHFDPGAMTLAQALTNYYWAIVPTVLARKDAIEAIGGFDPSFRECEDRDFIIRCCQAGLRVEGIPEPLARVRRQGQDGLTSQRWKIFRADLKLVWKHRRSYYGAYGLRGIRSFLLEKAHTASFHTRYVDGGVRLLMKIFKIKYEIRPGYQEPAGRTA